MYTRVKSTGDIESLIAEIKEAEFVSLDTETTSLNPRKGFIIGFSVSTKVGSGTYVPVFVWNKDTKLLNEVSYDGILAACLAKEILLELVGKKLILHNASFDTRFIKNFFGVDLISSIYCDTALLVHTVQEEGVFDEFPNRPFGLKEIAQSIQDEIGIDVGRQANQEQEDLKRSIKENGGSVTKDNYEIYKADLDILSRYAGADTDLTLRVFHHFSKVLRVERLEDFFYKEEVMPIYKEVTIPMEENGVKLDLPLIEKAREEIERDLEEYSNRVEKSLLGTDAGLMWLCDKAKKLFPVSNKGSFAQELVDLVELDLPKSKSGKYSLTKSVLEGYKTSSEKEEQVLSFLLDGQESSLDLQLITQIQINLWKKKNEGLIKVSSKQQLGEIVFGYMKLKPLTSTAKGNPQFDDDLVQELRKKFDWAEDLYIVNRLNKIRSAYIIRFLDRQEDGQYFFYYKQHGTVSGRYGSDAQQLPRPLEEGEDPEVVLQYNNIIRSFFISKPNRIFIDSDYESLEPRVFSSVSCDKGIQEIFEKGWDFYSTIAIKAEKLKDVSPDKSAPNYLKKVNPAKRRESKTYALGLSYGMSAFALSMTLGISQKEAENIVNGYLEGFPDFAKWREDSRQMMKEHGMVFSRVGRIRHLKKGKAVYDSIGDSILDARVRKQLKETFGSEIVMKFYRDYKNASNNCLNFQIQSLAASIVNRAALSINRRFKKESIDGYICAQIHDQLIADVSEKDVERAKKIMQDSMENTTKLEGVTLKAPPEIGHNWCETH